jgi:hypothetical protein
MEKKAHLIKSLELVIDALKNDTIVYDWRISNSCNAGVVAQALLGVTRAELKKIAHPLFNNLPEGDKTWKIGVKYNCPITGEAIPEIIKRLEDAGLHRNDIVHLEYLDNSAILANSTIKKIKIPKEVVTGTEMKTVLDKSSLWSILLGKKTQTSVHKKEIIMEEFYPDEYYADKENLIKYLVSWVQILKNEYKEVGQREDLEAELLVAVAEENYEKAAAIRDSITKLL